jgi:predicted negative regulator of RcsB-dependent stress response/putative ubiquitin-RnfH superfamily antitoxin RatB of RatAB toxin-antitoxin module
VGLSPARGQGNPGAKRRAPAPPSPEESALRSRAIHEAVEQCAALVEAGDHRKAVPMLADLRRALAKQAQGEDDSARAAARELPRVDALVARVALDSKAPDKALDFVRPYVEPRDAYNPDHADSYLVAGDALLALGKPYDALVIFDWMAGKADGVPLIRAAEGCGRALLARKEFQKAVESFRFAVAYAREYAYNQEALIRRLEGLLRDAQRLAEMDLYGEDFVRYRDAERLRRVEGKHAAAREVYLEIIQKWPETIYAEASRLYAAQCLVAMGKIPEAKQELAAFRASDPYGLYRGEAVLEMGRIALEYDLAPQAARGCFLLLETWLREVQDKTPLAIEKLAVREAAEKVTAPPAKEKYTDFWGNVKKNAIQPGQLVNRKTCPWYLDDLKEQMAMYLGFLAFVEGKKDEALAWYAKILECDPTTRRLDTAGEWNDYSRLKWGAEHGYLYAYPNDLRLYDKNPRQKLAVLLFDFYYVTDRSDKAEQLAKRLLAGDFGLLAPPLREYPQYAYATALYDTKGNDAAFREYLKILPAAGGRLATWTQCRAALAAANVGRSSSDPTIRQASRGLYVRLIRSNQQNEFTDKARIELARNLIDLEGRKRATRCCGRFRSRLTCFQWRNSC